MYSIIEDIEDITDIDNDNDNIKDKVQDFTYSNRREELHVLGKMASVIAHEIRNPLTTLRGFLQLLLTKDKYKEDQELFNLLIDELDRMNLIVSDFLNLAKDKVLKKEFLNLNCIIKSMEPLLKSDADNAGMVIKVEYGQIPDLLMAENQIRQLILNLVRNGIEAMDPNGTLYINTYFINNDIVLSVRDEGKGIDPSLIDKVSTPFFTTKDTGTGLGLPICCNIAAKHNGKVRINANNNGTTILVAFQNPQKTPHQNGGELREI